jgi:hypothetical protein
MSELETDPELTDEWHRIGTILVMVTAERPGGGTYDGGVPLTVEAKEEARRVSMDVDPDKAPVVIARWRDGIAESVNVFAGDYFPEEVCEALREQLTDFVKGGANVAVSTVTVHEDCRCHTAAGRIDMLRILRRLYYSGELAQRGGAIELGTLANDINREAGDLYDMIVGELFEAGPDAKDAVGALPKLRTAAIARARLDMALNALAAVPRDPDLTPAVITRREELMRHLADAEADEHEAIRILAAALAGDR